MDDRTGSEDADGRPEQHKVELPLPCIVCAVRTECAFRDGDRWQPYGATMFTTSGHYGSTVFDEITGGRLLTLNVCDECLTRHQDRLAVMTQYTPPTRFTFNAFSVEEEAER